MVSHAFSLGGETIPRKAVDILHVKPSGSWASRSNLQLWDPPKPFGSTKKNCPKTIDAEMLQKFHPQSRRGFTFFLVFGSEKIHWFLGAVFVPNCIPQALSWLADISGQILNWQKLCTIPLPPDATHNFKQTLPRLSISLTASPSYQTIPTKSMS